MREVSQARDPYIVFGTKRFLLKLSRAFAVLGEIEGSVTIAAHALVAPRVEYAVQNS